MGKFIEGLRRRTQQEAATAEREAEKILEQAWQRQLEEQRTSMKRAENKPQWKESRRQFIESGIMGILQKTIELGGAYGYYVDPEDFDDTLDHRWEQFGYWDPGSPYHYAQLHLEKTRRYHETFYQGGHSDTITTKYISIETDHEGTVLFRGSISPGNLSCVKIPVVVKVPKTKWEKNGDVLENALGKVYSYPLVLKHDEMVDSPFFDHWRELGGGLGNLGQALGDFRPKT